MSKNQGVHTALKSAVMIGNQRIIGRSSPGVKLTYSYFEKGCRKKCMRQSRKVLWVVLRSMFFIEILKEWHERPWTMFPGGKAKQQK